MNSINLIGRILTATEITTVGLILESSVSPTSLLGLLLLSGIKNVELAMWFEVITSHLRPNCQRVIHESLLTGHFLILRKLSCLIEDKGGGIEICI